MRVSLYFCEDDLYDCPDEYILPKVDMNYFDITWLILLLMISNLTYAMYNVILPFAHYKCKKMNIMYTIFMVIIGHYGLL